MKLTARSGARLHGEASVPGDKSCSHRALILAAMATGESRIEGLLESQDVLATVRAVEALGAGVHHVAPGHWRVEGGPWRSPGSPIDCGNSGTSARLLIGAIAGQEGVRATIRGDESLSRRPMRRVTAPLARMGARFEGANLLPLEIEGTRLGGIEHRNWPPSAQVKSALLLAGLGGEAPLRVIEPMPSRDHSERMLGLFGVEVVVQETEDGHVVTLGDERRLKACDVRIGVDPSSAAFPLLAASLVPGSAVTVRGVNVNPLRTGLYEVLEGMGADISLSNERLESAEILADIRLAHAPLRACHVAADAIPAMIDEIPALAMACAMADGESVIEGLAELRVKESDRLGALVAGLTACGVAAVADGDALRIFGRERVRGGGAVITHGDHRIAMAFLTLGLAAEAPVTIDRAEMIDTSFPGFADAMRDLGADIQEDE